MNHAVDTSISFSLASLDRATSETEAAARLHLFCRSSFDADMKDVNARLDALALLAGAKTSASLNYFPGWDPRYDSPALKQVRSTHAKLFGTEAKVYSVVSAVQRKECVLRAVIGCRGRAWRGDELNRSPHLPLHCLVSSHSMPASSAASSSARMRTWIAFPSVRHEARDVCVAACVPRPIDRLIFLSRAASSSSLCASGPTIQHAHSPQEQLLLDTVAPFYQWLKESIVNISKDSIGKM